jgi:hypothetical protein
MGDDQCRRRSPVELASALHQPTNDIAYHVQVLVRDGALIAAGTRPVRGVTEHFYKVGPLVTDHEDVIRLLLSAEEEPAKDDDTSSSLRETKGRPNGR